MSGPYKAYDIAVVIGRFQPCHLGHVEILEEANRISHNVIVLLGSANTARNIKNPFTIDERRQILKESVDFPFMSIGIDDYLYDDTVWLSQVQEKVSQLISSFWKKDFEPKVALVGSISDGSSYYLNLFPQWTFRNVNVKFPKDVHAVNLRKKIFGENMNIESIEQYLSTGSRHFLRNFEKTEAFESLCKEFHYIEDYKKPYASLPFPPTFVTTDAVVVHHGHILLIVRGGNPGKGLWALPGGFLNPNEKIIEGAMRELKEETGLKITNPDASYSLKSEKVFDHPSRSLRGRAITHAFYWQGHSPKLPLVKGADDAQHAQWVPIYEAMGKPNLFFEDHWHIINYFLNTSV